MKDTMDIETLRFFLVLYEYKHLTLAAQQCDLSKSAASRSLTKLREHFHDELFRKCANGMVATPRAQRLYDEVQKMLRLYTSLTKEEVFCPTKITKVFRISGVDNAITTYLSPAMKSIFAIARQMSVQFVPMVKSIGQSLRNGEIDFAVYPIPIQSEDIQSIPLAQDQYVVVIDKVHPLIEKWRVQRLTMQDLFAYRQVRITTDQQMTNESAWITERMDVPHESNEVALWTPYFYTTSQLVVGTDLWAAMPYHLAKRQQRVMRNFEILGRIPNGEILSPSLYWHTRTHNDPAYQWVRSMIVGTSKSLPDTMKVPEIRAE